MRTSLAWLGASLASAALLLWLVARDDPDDRSRPLSYAFLLAAVGAALALARVIATAVRAASGDRGSVAPYGVVRPLPEDNHTRGTSDG
ncbi:hypothetical protein [Demequina subtropica]|uniref:hypothetical protein n=1 Tax=Demequina subtropica TaxID=1638989 RepID=UPI00078245AD|nr:hypothetical protein [Demequina subtropica]